VVKYDKQDFKKELKDYDLVVDTMGGEIQNNSVKTIAVKFDELRSNLK
jgi:NADPH:quinone reductase-like Zn-dependent oxidoreductase